MESYTWKQPFAVSSSRHTSPLCTGVHSRDAPTPGVNQVRNGFEIICCSTDLNAMKALVGSVVHCEFVRCVLPEAESLRPEVQVPDGEGFPEVCEEVVCVPVCWEGAAVVGHTPASSLLLSGRPTLSRPMGRKTQEQANPPAANHPHAIIPSSMICSQ